MTSIKLDTVYRFIDGTLTETDEDVLVAGIFRDEADGEAYVSGAPADYDFGLALDEGDDTHILSSPPNIETVTELYLPWLHLPAVESIRLVLLEALHEQTADRLGYGMAWYRP